MCAFSLIKFEFVLGVMTDKFKYLGIGWVVFDSKTRSGLNNSTNATTNTRQIQLWNTFFLQFEYSMKKMFF